MASTHMFKHSVCEVCSSFYTSNPLMYISRYSEIIVTSGYDLGTGTTATPPGMFGKAQLSSRRELVEQLDSEPLFDYLVQNGALELPMVEELRNEKSSAKVRLSIILINEWINNKHWRLLIPDLIYFKGELQPNFYPILMRFWSYSS